jgi:methylaspartate mutase epsilon subunit
VRRWQYVDRLTGIYHERFGVVLDREFFGTLTATLIPPSTAIAIDIVEAALAAQQGVKCVSLGYAESGHRVQDVAAIRVLRELAARTLANLGYADVQVNTVFHQYMAAFPAEPARAEELVYQSGPHGAAHRRHTRPHQDAGGGDAHPHPGRQPERDHAGHARRRGGAYPRDGRGACGRGGVLDPPRGGGDPGERLSVRGRGAGGGVVEGFRRGFLDIPFAPSMYNRGEVSSAADAEGAIRYLSFGQLQVDREVREFHRSRLQERRRLEGTRTATQDYLLVERDVMRVPRLEYERWPLFDGSVPGGRGARAAGACGGYVKTGLTQRRRDAAVDAENGRGCFRSPRRFLCGSV